MITGAPAPRVDAQFDNTLVELKTGLNAVRNLRAGLVDLAFVLQDHPGSKGMVVLADAKISASRLNQEWEMIRRTFRPELSQRLSIVVFEHDQLRGLPRDPDPKIRNRLEHFIKQALGRHTRDRLPRPEYYAEILKLLVYQWMKLKGPMTAEWLARTVGCTYPTVAKSLVRLAPFLRRHSDRRFELERFPQGEWASLLAQSDKVRHTVRYMDRSGQPRSIDSLLKRMPKLQRRDIGVGGVMGARMHCPSLDLLGAQRLDLTLHSPDGRMDLSFVQRLDPGLVVSAHRDEPARLVVHALRRKEAFFTPGDAGFRWADPVECLFDLHEARLEPQAMEFLEFLTPRRDQPS